MRRVLLRILLDAQICECFICIGRKLRQASAPAFTAGPQDSWVMRIRKPADSFDVESETLGRFPKRL